VCYISLVVCTVCTVYRVYMLFNTRNVHRLNIRTLWLAWCSGVELRPDIYGHTYARYNIFNASFYN
jgi:hypothetical protein